MSRLVNEWVDTTEEAFGHSGAKGHQGELFVAKAMKSWHWDVELFESNRDIQVSGVDIRFKSPSWYKHYTADIKSNIDEYGNFFVETDDNGWLFNPKKVSDRIWHCNPNTGWMTWYGRYEMKKFLVDNNLTNVGLYNITLKQNISFLTRRKVAVNG